MRDDNTGVTVQQSRSRSEIFLRTRAIHVSHPNSKSKVEDFSAARLHIKVREQVEVICLADA